MTMIVAVEDIPQYYPSECSFGGGGANVNSKFLRVVNPDTATDTLLIGDTMFNEFAKAMGYIRKTDAHLLVEKLREEVVKVNAALADATDVLNGSASIVSALETVSNVLAGVRDSVDSVAGIATGVDEDADGTVEPTPES